MRTTPRRPGARTAVLFAAGAIAGLVVALGLPWQSRTTRADAPEEMEIKRLLLAFPGSVDIYLQAGDVKKAEPSLKGLRVTRTVEIAGVRFLRARKGDGEYWLVNPAKVVAFRVRRQEQ